MLWQICGRYVVAKMLWTCRGEDVVKMLWRRGSMDMLRRGTIGRELGYGDQCLGFESDIFHNDPGASSVNPKTTCKKTVTVY